MSIKFFYQDDIRRVSGTPPNYKALLQTVKQLFSDTLPSRFSLQYEDCEGDKVVLASDEDYETMVATELSDSSKCLKIHLIGATEDSISIIAKEIISSESEKEEEEELEPRFSQEMRHEVPLEVQERDVPNDDGEEETKSATVLIETEVVNSDSDAKKRKDISSQVDLIKEIELSSSLVKKSEEVNREVQTLDAIQVDQMRTIAKDALMEDLPKIARLVKEWLQNDEDKKRKTSSKFAVAMKSLKKKAEEKSKASQVVHSGVTCDKCGICPIVGIRYKCSVTENYDLCEKCEEKDTHPYPMLKIRNLAQAPYKVITELPPSTLMDIKAEDECEISKPKKKETLKTPKSKSKGKAKGKKVEVDEKDSKFPAKRGKSKGKRVEVKPKEMKPAFPYTFEKVAEVNQIPNVVTENSYMVYKTVTLKNSGECAWPSNAYIKCIDNAGGEPTSVTEIESGKQINVILAMKSPGKIGKYSSKWQLCYTADEGQEVLLGSPFDLEFEVRDSKFEEEIKVQVEDKPKKEFTAEVLKQAKALKDIFHEKDLETICEYVANSPQKTLEEMIEEYLSFA